MVSAVEQFASERHAAFLRLAQARHHEPHALLGARDFAGRRLVVCWRPGAVQATLAGVCKMTPLPVDGAFGWEGPPNAMPEPYRVRYDFASCASEQRIDPWCFPPVLEAAALARFSRGDDDEAWRMLGAHVAETSGVMGVRFAVWAPNAERVSVVGPFNDWDGRRHPLTSRGKSGIWELFIPDLPPGVLYKFELRNRAQGTLHLRSDPYGRRFEQRPATASQVEPPSAFAWTDGGWLAARAAAHWLNAPMSVYEVHLGSWRRSADGGFLNYRELAGPLAEHARQLGFTHVELLPVTEHPLDDSWGYQVGGYFAPTSRHGSPDDFRALVDRLHGAGLGVILDWVPGHFPRDEHVLARFDGTSLYEHPDPRRGEQPDWGTLVFDLARREVRSFLRASASYWLDEFHADGLRVDAVAAMLYLDYSRGADAWLPNVRGGRENLDAVDFLKRLNAHVHGRFPGAVTIAEESTDWPGVSRPVETGGLGFSMKWNMGWMHDTLEYFSKDPVHRGHHHQRLTFSMMYAHRENFVLPLSHDEVVHLKGSLLGKMPGDDWQRFANLRLLLAWQWTWPGKKLLFMGGEFGQPDEWDFRQALPWGLMQVPGHRGVARLVGDLNRLYRLMPALHRHDFDPAGFQWLDCDDRDSSVLAFLRWAGDDCAAVALNFTPVPRPGYRIGLPRPGAWREVLNSDSAHYDGSNLGNLSTVQAEPVPAMGQEWSATVTLPPLACVVFVPAGDGD